MVIDLVRGSQDGTNYTVLHVETLFYTQELRQGEEAIGGQAGLFDSVLE
jgi:hypothetical protein